MRPDKVCTHLLYLTCRALSIEMTNICTHAHAHTQRLVYERKDITVWWNQAVHTNREVTANRPDIIIKNQKEKTCILIDVAIPAVRNVVQKEVEKKLKYESL